MDKLKNYMFFQNLKQIQKDVNYLLSLDKEMVDEIISDNHGWAVDHISTSKDDVEEVTNFFSHKEDKPYDDVVDAFGTITRTFSENVDKSMLEWHRDKEDRRVVVLEDSDWFFQFDNELPRRLSINEEIYIPKNTFHRIIKGTTNLVVEITEK